MRGGRPGAGGGQRSLTAGVVHAPPIHPDLVEGSLLWYFVKNYVLAPFLPRFGSMQIGRAPFDPPDGNTPNTATADIQLVG